MMQGLGFPGGALRSVTVKGCLGNIRGHIELHWGYMDGNVEISG